MKYLFATTSYAAIVAYSNTVVIRSLIDGSPVTIDLSGFDASLHELHPDGGLLGMLQPTNRGSSEQRRAA